MHIEVSFYGSLVRLAGGRTRTVQVEGEAPTVSDLRAALSREIPGIARHLPHVAVGMGTELLPDQAPLEPGAEVSLLPPVSGGEEVLPRVQDGPLDLAAILRETEGVDDGALVVFAGNVRASDGGLSLAGLDYDVHLEMAEATIRRIERDIEEKEGVLRCRIVHRVGHVPAGEASVYVVVRGRHRPEAFEAAREGIDRVKSEAPIWKEDVLEGGERRPRPTDSGVPLTPGGTGVGKGRSSGTD
jgi:molybdopterin synthase catalytic subunit/molybdopterin converting factor small subunit